MKEKISKFILQLIKFGIVGVLATLLEWIIFYVLTNLFNIHYSISTAIGFSISTVFNYILSVKFVFEVNKEKKQSSNFIFFVSFSLIGLLLNELIMYIVIDKIGINDMIGKIIATFIVMIFNFVTRKIFLEKR